MRRVLLALAIACVAGCGEGNGIDAAMPADAACWQPHRCSNDGCCDPVCATASSGTPCDRVGYSCQFLEESCTCGGDRTWDCRYPMPPADMARTD
jgi:hypothetical protein